MEVKNIVIIVAILVVSIVALALVITNQQPVLPAAMPNTNNEIVYLPLGDSYTIGESVSPAERFPNQLVARLQSRDLNLTIPANPAVTGYTSQDLIDQELPLVDRYRPDIVTLAIGVNDYVQGVGIATFEKNLSFIVSKLVADRRQIILLTIPDFGKTPAGQRFGSAEEIETAIKQYNAVIQDVGRQTGVPVADIFPISQGAGDQPELTASDGLHPSGLQYGLWVEEILPLLKDFK